MVWKHIAVCWTEQLCFEGTWFWGLFSFSKEIGIFKGSGNLFFTEVCVQTCHVNAKHGNGNSIMEMVTKAPPKISNNYKLVFIGAQLTESYTTGVRGINFLLFPVLRPSRCQPKLSYKTRHTTVQQSIDFWSTNPSAVTMLLDKTNWKIECHFNCKYWY